MGIINIEGLGEIEIQGDTPTPEEEKAILEALGATTDTTDTIETEDVDTSKVSPGIGDVEKGLETESIIPQLMETEQAEGLDKIFTKSGFEWREPGCSMCLAMNADKLKPEERCASTSNRNFEGRQGRGGRTHLVSPGMAAAAAISGNLDDVRKYQN